MTVWVKDAEAFKALVAGLQPVAVLWQGSAEARSEKRIMTEAGVNIERTVEYPPYVERVALSLVGGHLFVVTKETLAPKDLPDGAIRVESVSA